MKVKDLIALIESDGWQLVRQRGSHRINLTNEATTRLTISVSVLKQAGLKQ